MGEITNLFLRFPYSQTEESEALIKVPSQPLQTWSRGEPQKLEEG